MRQFIAETNPDSRGCLVVEKDKFHYLRNVLRVSTGDMIYVRLPDGLLQQMTVALVDSKKKRMVLQTAGNSLAAQNEIGSATNAASAAGDGDSTEPIATKKCAASCTAAPEAERPRLELWLFQFVAKPAKMEMIIRQAVECGVQMIVPVVGTFCQSGSVISAKEAARNNAKGGRWERIITEAREQSGSAVETNVHECVSVAEACEVWKAHVAEGESHAMAVVLYEQTAGTKLIHEAASAAASITTAAIAVGAEGGIAPEEIDYLQKNGFTPVHFATNILRCETAALYGIAALQTALVENCVWQNRE